jgi:hypothetical protein
MRGRLSFANVMSVIAVFIALGGASYAAVKLPKNSVGTKQIKNRAVTPPKVSPSVLALLKGEKGDRGDRGEIGPAGGTASFTPEIVQKASAFDTITPKELIVECPNGPVISGGFVLASTAQENLRAVRNYAVESDAWLVRALDNGGADVWQLTAYAICMP